VELKIHEISSVFKDKLDLTLVFNYLGLFFLLHHIVDKQPGHGSNTMNVTKQVRTPRMQFFRLQGHICSHIIDYIYTGCVPKYVHSRQEGTYMPGADFSFSAHTIDMAYCSSFADRLYYGYPCAAAAGNDTTAHPSTRLATYAANATSAGTNAGHRTAGTPRTPSWRWTQEAT